MEAENDRIRSGLKLHTFSNGDIKIKGWLDLSDLEKIKTEEGRVYIEILPRFEKTPSGFTHFVKKKLHYAGVIDGHKAEQTTS